MSFDNPSVLSKTPMNTTMIFMFKFQNFFINRTYFLFFNSNQHNNHLPKFYHKNAKKYFDRYGKLKRTYEALTTLIEETKDEITHLESIATALDIAVSEDDLVQIKEELIEFGYIRKKRGDKKAKIKSKPFHYISSDGFHIYVGKNNYQNDELTFKFATGNDWWFHAKGMPGSHVIVKTEGEELPDRTFEEAGRLAGFYSKGRDNDKVEIDYLQKKNVKKPNKSAPGFVVYYTNYSLTIQPDISGIEQLS